MTRAVHIAALLLSLVAGCAQAGIDRQSFADGAVRGDAGPLGCEGETCGSSCIDTATDPLHCGGCGRTCVVPHAEAACAEGACTVGTCETGYADCDGDPNNGCERAASCASGESCTTSCGTTGTITCSSACDTTCAPPAETCNLTDDDCDGACEAGLPGCRLAVHRSNGPNGHFYTTSAAEAACCGMHVEAPDYFYLSAVAVDGTQPLMRCLAGDGHHLYTTDTGCEGVAYEGQMGFILREPRCGAAPLYRLRHGNGDHFYTTSDAERDHAVSLGYTLVGRIGWVLTSP